MKNHLLSRHEFCLNLEIWSKIVIWLDHDPFPRTITIFRVSYTCIMQAPIIKLVSRLVAKNAWKLLTKFNLTDEMAYFLQWVFQNSQSLWLLCLLGW